MMLAFAKPRPEVSLLETLGELGNTLVIVVTQAILAGALIATLLAWLIARNIANPLQKSATAAQAVSEGDFTQRVPSRWASRNSPCGEVFQQHERACGGYATSAT
ncbi:MAG UNVERIFIED_CONTAM: HAMP domain-containing protein [Anaerolineae bacterium]